MSDKGKNIGTVAVVYHVSSNSVSILDHAVLRNPQKMRYSVWANFAKHNSPLEASKLASK
jgi:hypothetical protein